MRSQTQPCARPQVPAVAIPEVRAAETYAEATVKADPASVQALIGSDDGDPDAPCGLRLRAARDGTGQPDGVPRLAGLAAGYLTKQLHDYRNGSTRDGNMQYVRLDPRRPQMAALGAYYAALQAPPSAPEYALGGDLDRGRALALRSELDRGSAVLFFMLHGPLGWGRAVSPPSRGARPISTSNLTAWKSGTPIKLRLGLMRSVAKALSPRDMSAVSDYLATLPPPQPRYPGQ